MFVKYFEKIKSIIFANDLDKWFKYLNLLILLPSLAWPYVLFILIFLFDNPKSYLETWLIVFSIIFYPVYLLIICLLNIKLFRLNKILGAILPGLLVIPTAGVMLILLGVALVNSLGDNLKELDGVRQYIAFIWEKIH